jgi:hypothetical protein
MTASAEERLYASIDDSVNVLQEIGKAYGTCEYNLGSMVYLWLSMFAMFLIREWYLVWEWYRMWNS